ncbi:MAG: hypothetical protein EBT95_00580 [Verrucomicrobia bacterium]|nr:hypothetical protein [Verrucomicrobiota bacterium]
MDNQRWAMEFFHLVVETNMFQQMLFILPSKRLAKITRWNLPEFMTSNLVEMITRLLSTMPERETRVLDNQLQMLLSLSREKQRFLQMKKLQQKNLHLLKRSATRLRYLHF